MTGSDLGNTSRAGDESLGPGRRSKRLKNSNKLDSNHQSHDLQPKERNGDALRNTSDHSTEDTIVCAPVDKMATPTSVNVQNAAPLSVPQTDSTKLEDNLAPEQSRTGVWFHLKPRESVQVYIDQTLRRDLEADAKFATFSEMDQLRVRNGVIDAERMLDMVTKIWVRQSGGDLQRDFWKQFHKCLQQVVEVQRYHLRLTGYIEQFWTQAGPFKVRLKPQLAAYLQQSPNVRKMYPDRVKNLASDFFEAFELEAIFHVGSSAVEGSTYLRAIQQCLKWVMEIEAWIRGEKPRFSYQEPVIGRASSVIANQNCEEAINQQHRQLSSQQPQFIQGDMSLIPTAPTGNIYGTGYSFTDDLNGHNFY